MSQLYKVTDRHGCTTNDTRWGPSITHTADELFQFGNLSPSSTILCAYRSPELAALFAPVHLSQFPGYRLWIADGHVKYTTPTSANCDTLTTVDECAFPNLDIAERIRCCVFATLNVFQNDVWRLWALNWLMSGKCTKHQTASAKAAAEMAGATAEQQAKNATGQYIFKTNMYRGRALFEERASPFCHMPEEIHFDAIWKMELARQVAKADAAAAQAACWATDAVSSFLGAKSRDIEIASRLLKGLQRLPKPGLFATTKVLLNRAQLANSLASTITECLGWAEMAAEQKCLAAATRAESDARQSWKASDDIEERNACRDTLRMKAIEDHRIDFQRVVETALRETHPFTNGA